MERRAAHPAPAGNHGGGLCPRVVPDPPASQAVGAPSAGNGGIRGRTPAPCPGPPLAASRAGRVTALGPYGAARAAHGRRRSTPGAGPSDSGPALGTADHLAPPPWRARSASVEERLAVAHRI